MSLAILAFTATDAFYLALPCVFVAGAMMTITTGISREGLKVCRLAAGGDGFGLPVQREISSGFEASAELEPIDRRRGGIIRAVVALGNR
jgi:hypothetical protein